MARKEIGTGWDRNNRNAMNDNFKELYTGMDAAAQKAIEEIGGEFEAFKAKNDTNFLDAVSTVVERDSKYPQPENGDTVRVTSEAAYYRYETGAGWKKTDEYNPTAIDHINQQLAEKVKPVFNIKAWGATGDGTGANDQMAFNQALEHLISIGGGTLYFPVGHYRLEGMPLDNIISYVGEGITRSKISLPDSPTTHMFVPRNTGDTTVEGATFRDLHFSGLKNHAINAGTSAYNCWHCKDYQLTMNLTVENCWVTNFKVGYQGSDNDRWVYLTNVRFWWNDIGIYGGEHPIVNACDIRENNIGITGRLNDFKMSMCTVSKNNVGVQRDTTKATTAAYIDNSTFENCGFFANRQLGLELGFNNVVVGCRFVGWTETMPDAIHVLSAYNTINACQFGYAESTQFAAAIQFKSGGGRQIVSDNKFVLYGQNKGIVLSAAFHEHYNIEDNLFYTDGSSFFEVPATATFTNSIFNGNNISVLANGNVPRPLINIPTTTGFIMTSNTIRKHSTATVSKFVSCDATSSIIADNRFVGGGSNAVELLKSDAFTIIRDNLGYSTKTSSTAWIDAGAGSVVVNHGLGYRPKLSDIYIVPMSVNAASAGFYVTDITETSFKLNVIPIANETGGRMFAWTASIFN